MELLFLRNGKEMIAGQDSLPERWGRRNKSVSNNRSQPIVNNRYLMPKGSLSSTINVNLIQIEAIAQELPRIGKRRGLQDKTDERLMHQVRP